MSVNSDDTVEIITLKSTHAYHVMLLCDVITLRVSDTLAWYVTLTPGGVTPSLFSSGTHGLLSDEINLHSFALLFSFI